MKKILISILLILSLFCGLIACNESPEPNGGGNDNSQTGGNTDGGNTDGGNTDGGNTDGGNTDGGNPDGGNTDGGNTDGGNTDGGNTDGGNTDGGNTDGGMSENEKIQLKAYLSTLLESYLLDPYSYLPESMTPQGNHLNSKNQIVTDYSGFVNTGSIAAGGFGEQWNMILENMAQSQVFYRALEVIEGLTTSSVVAFNNYLDNNPDATASHSFQNGIYTVTIYFEDDVLFYVLDYTLAGQTAQIALSLDVETNEKTVRVQIGDANALCYTVTEDAYTFAIRYLGVRRAFFMVERDGEDVTGHIYEYLTVAGVEIASAADFYVRDGYVSAVGNKADGMVGFKGYISELYDLDTGKLIGYEVKETLSALSYDTLWFDLNTLTGLQSIKYREQMNDDTPAAFFINGKSTPWTPKKPLVGSRHYDIEFRTQYFYVYNATDEAYEVVKAQVPMFFIQEKYYNDLTDEVNDKNNVTLTSNVSTADLNKLLSDYDTLIDIFMQNKEIVTVDTILAFIGNKITH